MIYIIGSWKQKESINSLESAIRSSAQLKHIPVTSFIRWGEQDQNKGSINMAYAGMVNLKHIDRAKAIVWVLPPGLAGSYEAGYAEGKGIPVIRYWERCQPVLLEDEPYLHGPYHANSPTQLIRALTAMLMTGPVL